MFFFFVLFFVFFQAEDGIRYLVRSRGLGDVYKRQVQPLQVFGQPHLDRLHAQLAQDVDVFDECALQRQYACLLYTSDAADERSSVDLGGRRIIKKKTHTKTSTHHTSEQHKSVKQRAQ